MAPTRFMISGLQKRSELGSMRWIVSRSCLIVRVWWMNRTRTAPARNTEYTEPTSSHSTSPPSKPRPHAITGRRTTSSDHGVLTLASTPATTKTEHARERSYVRNVLFLSKNSPILLSLNDLCFSQGIFCGETGFRSWQAS
jgi:hypothetical protein